jgi:hypothetical protein
MKGALKEAQPLCRCQNTAVLKSKSAELFQHVLLTCRQTLPATSGHGQLLQNLQLLISFTVLQLKLWPADRCLSE